MQLKKTVQPQHRGAAYSPAHLAVSKPTGIRRVLCTAGLTALLAFTIAPASHADATDEIPDSSWTPDVPSIDNTAPEPEPPVDPGPIDPGPSDPGIGDGTGDGTGDVGGDGSGSGDVGGGDDPGYVEPQPEIPDSGSSAPDYNYYPPSSGGTGAASEWAFFDPAEPPAEAEPAAEEAPVEAPVISVPVFTSYDAATRMLSGTAQPGAIVRIADGAGNPLVEDIIAAENGVFSVVLPEGVDLSTLSIFVVNENGEQVSDALLGATIVEEVAKRELAEVRTTVGTSTSDLATGLLNTVGAMGIAGSVEQPEEETMPPLPYILGAVAGVVAVGAVAGGIVAWRRRSADEGDDEGPALVQSVVAMPSGAVSPTSYDRDDSGSMASPFGAFVDLDETGSFSAVVNETVAPVIDDDDDFASVSSYAPPARAAYTAEAELDDIEMLAMNMHGASTEGSAPSGSARSSHGSHAVVTGADPDDDPLPPRGPGGGQSMYKSGDTAAFMAVASQGQLSGEKTPGVGSSHAAHFSQVRAAAIAEMWEGDPAATLPGSVSEEPQDIETFKRTAHLLATGTGAVHRVTKSYENLDLSGLDAISSAPVSPNVAGDSFVVNDDWRALALSELAAGDKGVEEMPREHAHLSTDDYVALVSTQRREGVATRPASPSNTYVAPVVGPTALGHTDAMRRHAMLRESMAPAAIALRNRDEAFKNQRTYTFEAQRAVSAPYSIPSITEVNDAPGALQTSVAEPAPKAAPAVQAPQSQEVAQRPTPTSLFRRAAAPRDDVPVIARGATCATPGPLQRATSVSDRVAVEKQSLSVPDPAAFAPVPVAPVTPMIPERGVAAAVAAAQNVYAAYAPVNEGSYNIPDPEALIPEPPAKAEEPQAVPEVVASSVAAAYAAAVYENVHVPEHYLPPSFTAQMAPVAGHNSLAAVNIPAVELEGDFSDPYSTEAGYSAAYINYMVQDEFEHRHDTPAQRNAALGRMRIVNGAACAPVPLSETLRHRHPA